MGIIAQARLDLIDIITNANDFGVTLIFYAADSPVSTATVIGTGRHIDYTFDELGMVKGLGSNATCTVTEASLIAAGYPYKNGSGDYDFYKHRVTMQDATKTGYYMVKTWIPNDGLGIISFELADYE